MKGINASSIVKKFNDHNFAAKIDRSEIQLGMDKLGVKLEDHIQTLAQVFEKMPEFN